MNPQAEAILNGLAYLEAHLCEPMTVGDMADAAGYSLFHFIRTFNKIVRHTPYDYLIRRRLSHAAKLLLESDARVLDIALICQFSSHEGFTRAFNRLFSMAPTSWRNKGFQDQRLFFPPLGKDDLFFRQLPDFKPPVLTQLDKLCLLGWMNLNSPETDNDAALREAITKALSKSPPKDAGTSLWEVRSLPESPHERENTFLGICVDKMPLTTGRYVLKVIKGGQVLCFSHQDMPQYRQAALNYLYHSFIPKSGLSLGEAIEIRRQGESPMLYLPVLNTRKKG